MTKKQPALNSIYSEILALKNLKPCFRVNRLFSELVTLVLDPKTKNTLKIAEVEKLQLISSQAEYELEKYWAKRIVKSDDPQKTLDDFPYYRNYEQLVQLERLVSEATITKLQYSLLLVGGGPLPLTAILLSKKTFKRIVVLEIDHEAFLLSSTLIKKLGLDKKIKIIHIDAQVFPGYQSFDWIVVSVLAGIERGVKKGILDQIAKNLHSEARVLVRSSWGSRCLLYRPVSFSWLRKFRVLVEIKPHNEIINSTFVLTQI
jgi:nicotianamine synthase